MKKIVIAILSAAIIIIALFFPITKNKTIIISATFDNTFPQIIHLENWKNWYPGIKEAYEKNPASYRLEKDSTQKKYTIIVPGKKYIIHVISPMSYQVSEISGNWANDFAFSFFPSDTARKIKINFAKKTSLLFSVLRANKAGENAMKGLKFYLEDPKSFYGFGIEPAQIRDSVIASSAYRIRRKDIFSKIQNAYLNLIQYVKTNGLIKTGHTSISYSSLPNDSLLITVGVPVNKTALPDKEISCLALPAKGKILVATYEGLFSDRKKIYLAIWKYMTDHTLSAPAQPFERYLNDSIPSSDSSVIKIELDYPIY